MDNIFWCVNTQKDFFKKGKYNIPSSENILNNLNDLTQLIKLKNIKTINMLGWYPLDSNFLSKTPDYIKTYPIHCTTDSEGARFIEETTPLSYYLVDWNTSEGVNFMEINNNSNLVITNKNIDPFNNSNSFTETVLHNLGTSMNKRPEFVVYGINIKNTVLGLLKRGYRVTIVSDANREFNGLPLTKEEVSPTIDNPLEDGFRVKENLDLSFTTTKELLSNV
jgi:nicotinamidase-related amidase